MKTLASLFLIIVVLLAGLVGYVAGANVGIRTATTSEQITQTIITTSVLRVTSISTNVSNLENYWNQAYASSWQYFQLSRAQLVPLLNVGNTSLYIVDVRQANGTAGYSTGHIAGAHNIPFQNMSAAVVADLIPRSKIIIDVCYTGQTGAMTTAILRELGYTAYNLSGGMAGWNNATRISASSSIAVGENYPIVSGEAPGIWTTFNP